MASEPTTTDRTDPTAAQDNPAPACVMSFNSSDATGADGIAGDIATIAAMGAHALPVVTAVVLRDSAEIMEHHTLDPDVVAEQARVILEDIPISAWKVGFLGSPEGISAVAEILSDYPDVPLVAYMPALSWIEENEQSAYADAFRELVLPQTEVLVGNQQVLTDLLLPEWDGERPASARELAVAAHEHGARHVLVTGVSLPDQYVDNVLASPQGAITGERFERFDVSFVGAGDTLSSALAALLASRQELSAAVGEALAFLDQSLDAGFRPGMGNVIPDRFFWALPPAEEGEATEETPTASPDPRRVH